jgi:hypothetical protein
VIFKKYSLLNIHVARVGEKRNAYGILMGEPEGKKPLGIPRRRYEDNIRMDLREIGWGGMDWIDVAQDRDQWRALDKMLGNYFFDPEDGGDMFLRNVGWNSTDYTASYPRR